MRHPRVLVATSVVTAGGLGAAMLGAPAFATGPSGRHGASEPTVHGTVSSVGTDSFTLTRKDGSSVLIKTTKSTRFAESGDPKAPSGVQQGDRVVVWVTHPSKGHRHHHRTRSGTTSAPTPTPAASSGSTSSGTAAPHLAPANAGTTNTGTANRGTTPSAVAKRVEIVLVSAHGIVGKASSGGFTVTDARGHTTDVTVGSTTTYFDGASTPTTTAPADGDHVVVYGTKSSSGLNALFVHIRPASPGGTATMSSPSSNTSTSAVKPSVVTADESATAPSDRRGPDGARPETADHDTSRQVIVGFVKSSDATPDSGTIVITSSHESNTNTVTVGMTTQYFTVGRDEHPQPTTASAVKPGERIAAIGTESNGQFTASRIYVSPTPTGQPVARPGDRDGVSGSGPTPSGQPAGTTDQQHYTTQQGTYSGQTRPGYSQG